MAIYIFFLIGISGWILLFITIYLYMKDYQRYKFILKDIDYFLKDLKEEIKEIK